MKTFKPILFLIILCTSLFGMAQTYINEIIVKAPNPTDANWNSLIFGTQGAEGIEIYNPTCGVLDISHWFLVANGSAGDLKGTFRFPSGTSISVGGRLTVGAPGTGSIPGALAPNMVLHTFVGTPNLGWSGSRWYLDNTRGYVALYDANGVPKDLVYWHGTSTGEGCGSWNSSNTSDPWYSTFSTAPVYVPAGSAGAPVVASLPGPGNPSIEAVKRCAGYVGATGNGSIQSAGDGNLPTSRVNVLTFGAPNAGTPYSSASFTVTAALTDATCGASDGSIVLTPNPAGTYTYTWSNPLIGNTSAASGLSAGTYSVNIASASGCSKDTSFTISSSGGPDQFVFSAQDETCSLGNGSLTVSSASGGTGPYSYSLDGSNYFTSNVFSNLSNGNYVLYVQDNLGCQGDTVFAIGSIAGPQSVDITITNATCTSGGSLNVNAVSGGTPAYNYSIDGVNFQSGTLFTALSNGNYTLTVSDGTGCELDSLISIGLNGGPSEVTLTLVPETCGNGNGSITQTAVTGGSAPYLFALNGSAFTSATSYGSLAGGTHTFSVQDNAGCVFDSLVTLPSIAGPTDMTLAISPNTCSSQGGITVTNVTGGTPAYQYGLNGSTPTSTASFSSLTPGWYTLTVLDANSCELDSIIAIADNTQLTATISTTPNSACLGCNYSGPSIMINEINIYPNNGDGSIFGPGPNPVSEGEWIELYNPDWCDSVDISGYILGSYNSTGSTLSVPYVSNGMAFVIPNGTVVPPLGFVVVRGQNAPAPPAGVVDVIVTNATNNLCIDGGLGVSRLWFQNAGGWFGFYDASGVPQDMISWGAPTPSDLNGNPCIPPTNSLPVGVTQLASYNATGIGLNLGPSSLGMTYVRIPDGGAWSSAMSTENFSYGNCNDPLNCLAETGVTVCNGTATASVTAGTAPFTYTWNDPAVQTSASASGLCPGTYQLTLSDAAGCTQTYNAVISDDVFTIDAAVQDPSCANNDGTIVVTADPATSLYSYVWSANTGITDSTTTNATGLGEGTYSVSVTAGACVRDTTLTLSAPAAIDSVSVSVSPTLCGQTDGSILIEGVFGGTAPYTYDFNGTGSGIDTSYTNLAAGTYSLEVTDDEGCTYLLNGLIVDPSSGITSIDVDEVLPDCGQSNGELEVIAVNGGSSPYNYALNGAALDSTIATGLSGNTYILQVQDANGCAYSQTIILGEDGKSFVTIPNVFTPNGDNSNDNWFISTGCVQKLHVIILNRWGNVVHEYEDVNGKWDGLTNGDKVTEGVYFYKADIEFTSGEKQTEHGNITVIY